MTALDWNKKFGDELLITLSDEERRYLALAPIPSSWETKLFFSKTNLWYTKTIVYFDGNIIVKVISETKKVTDKVIFESYVESDTHLVTDDRTQLLPLTPRGKAKPLTASNIDAVIPFGCSFKISYTLENGAGLCLSNPRANKEFPIGEWEARAAIRSEADFHAFMNEYISTCRSDYFDKLEAFKTAQKVTIKYKPGDIFRMDYDRTRYCYGIITGDIKQIKSMPELPKKHSLRNLMTVPIMVRTYQLLTEDPDMTAEDLKDVPLGRMEVCSDNDIIWGTHTIVDHKRLEPEDLEFNFVCSKIVSRSPYNTLFTQDMLMHEGFMPKQEYTLYIEWGFAQASLTYDQLSERLKEWLDTYISPHTGVSTGISAYYAVVDDNNRDNYIHRNNLLNPDNRDILNEIFSCLHLKPDTTFDQFAEKFGGLSLHDIAMRVQNSK